MRRTGVISVCNRTDLDCIAPLKCVPKSDGGTRVCLNTPALNDFLQNEDIYLDDPFDALHWNAAYYCKIDLKSAFYQVLIHPNSRKYFGFTYGGNFFQFNRLVMGVSPSPGLVSQIFTVLKAYLKTAFPGLKMGHFIDDFLFAHNNAMELARIMQEVVKFFGYLGVALSLDKCQLIPSRGIEWLGLWLTRDSIRVPKDKVDLYSQIYNEYKRTKSFVLYRKFMGML